MIQEKETSDLYAGQFAAFEQETAGKVPVWLSPLRKAAFSRFTELGWPTRHDEEWRFTPIAPIKETAFQRAPQGTGELTKASLARFSFSDLGCATLVFVGGRYAPELSSLESLPSGAQVGSLAVAFKSDTFPLEAHLGRHAGFENHAFTALNTAFLEDGAVVFLPKNAVVEKPIHLLYVSSASGEPTISHPRALLIASENSQATIIESYVGEGVYFTNAVTEVFVAENAVVDHYKLLKESDEAFHIASMHVLLHRSGNFSSHAMTLGGALVRNEASAILDGEGGECTLNGLYLAGGRRLVDNHTAIDHAKPRCASHELYRGILDDRARGVFNGKIFVRQDAQKTDAKQTNMTLLLSDDAQINTKPQLEIFADDVRCTHGATVGQLNADQLFYLRARGIGLEEARRILIHAFAGDVINRIKVETVREQTETLLSELLPKASA